jgi:fructosamine-3-kinase
MSLAHSAAAAALTPPALLDLSSVERAFHYVVSVPFPNGGTPVAVRTLYGSSCNDICRVTVQTGTSSAVGADNSDPASMETHPVTHYFLKSCRGAKQDEILLEAGGLALLRLGGLPVPPVVLAGEVEGTVFLVEPFIECGEGLMPCRHLTRDEASAGRALAHLHRCRSADGRFGCRRVAASLNTGDVVAPAGLSAVFARKTATPNSSHEASANATAVAAEAYTSTFVWSTSWPELYVDHLLQPQVARARQRGLWSTERQSMFEVFAERFRAHFATRAVCAQRNVEVEVEGERAETPSPSPPQNVNSQGNTDSSSGPAKLHQEQRKSEENAPACSLLHGDIWGGNLMFDASGQPLFIDPQPLYGDREMDIAMTELFGGFGAAFYAAYEAAYPLDEDADMRVPWYQLYYLLMHLNLFGEGYGRAVDEALQSV